MSEAGLDSLFPMERLSVNGLVEPLRRLPELLARRRGLARHLRTQAPRVFLGIDSPDFNLGLARAVRASGIPTAQLVSPSVWAWRRGRLKGIARSVDLMLCLFPFETEVYRERGIPARCVGHPMADEIAGPVDSAQARRALGLPREVPLLALLPGSRAGEVEALMPLFLQAADHLRLGFPALNLVVPAASAQRMLQLRAMVRGVPGITLVQGQSRQAIAAADAVLVAAGTATLEAALLRRPMVVAYRMHGASWFVLSRLVRTPWVALPNLLAGRELVSEFLQDAATPEALAGSLASL